MDARELRDGMKEISQIQDRDEALQKADRLITDYLEDLAKRQLDGRAQKHVLEAVKIYREHRG